MSGILALIPARGGSKGVPRKNIRKIGGRPLIGYSIEAALQSGILSDVIVSTEDEEIALVARDSGAAVPFLRPSEIAGDEATQLDAIDHFLHAWQERGSEKPDYLMLLQPTSPFRSAQDIRAAAELALRTDAPAIVSVCEPHHHPVFAKRLADDGSLIPFIEGQPIIHRRQDVPQAYALNGAIFLVKLSSYQRNRNLEPEGALPYVMPPERSLEIDTEWDLRVAEAILAGKGVDAR